MFIGKIQGREKVPHIKLIRYAYMVDLEIR